MENERNQKSRDVLSQELVSIKEIANDMNSHYIKKQHKKVQQNLKILKNDDGNFEFIE